MPKLEEYRKKRDPKATPEPFGGEGSAGAPVFVVQKHAARSLHYDFRLERNGALASWAVPKGVPVEPGAKALAVHVEDHPLDYATFAGEIPKGSYGAGTVEIWDHGTYELLEAKDDGGLKVRLRGERFQGVWTLVPAHLDGKEQNWLLIRSATDAETVKPSAGAAYKPMLATLSDVLPSGAGWLYELKFDGYRALAYVRGGKCELRSRNGNDLTGRFAAVAQAVADAAVQDAVIDGEVCALDDRGHPSFSAMQQGSGRLVYYVFDCLEVGGTPVVGRALEERRELLAELVRPNASVSLSAAFEDGPALYETVERQGLEGVMAKRKGSRYAQGRRGRDWLKVKTHGRQEFVIAGYTRGTGHRSAAFGSLVLAVNDGGERYAGNVGTGFDDREIARLLALLRPLERSRSPFAVPPKLPRVRRGDVTWVEPRLVAEVEFSEWTHDGHVRQPSYKGLREDKAPSEVRHERPRPDVIRAGKRELSLSNLDKLFWPDEGITKGDLLEYYRAVAPVLVPHLKGRPFTMRRYPDGAFGKVFFQKDAPSHMPAWIRTFATEVTTRSKERAQRTVSFPVVDDELALLWMVNMGCIDMNPWYSRVDRPDRPDFVLFDLDPTPEVPYAQTVEVALILKALLDSLCLESFPKTSGGKGFHVLVPLDRRSTYEETRAFAEHVAGVIARAYPVLATTAWAKSKRRGVLIDANQNGMGKTIASVYSVRPHPGAPVSTPLAWEEVVADLDPAAFTMGAVLDRVGRAGDLFGGMLETRQSLSKALRRLTSGS